MQTKPNPGQRVRLTGDFLRNTGQIAGGEGQKRWTVQLCHCRLCDGPFIAVNELSPSDPSRARHINYRNLEKCR